MTGKLIILSAPSGAGKTTIMRRLEECFAGRLEFSISATSRAPRGAEKEGVDYYFLSSAEFARAVADDRFVEWEEVYAGTCYGTLRAELQRIWDKGHAILFDVDVKGGLRLKELFGERALAIFVMPPSVEELRRRLIARGTDNSETIERRVAKAAYEIEHHPGFDRVIVNDDLETAVEEAAAVVKAFIS